MPRKRKPVQEAPDRLELDQALVGEMLEAFNSEPVTDSASPPDEAPAHEDKPSRLLRRVRPLGPKGPPEEAMVQPETAVLSDRGNAMHLARHFRLSQMQIRFDERPDERYLNLLRDAGWKYWMRDRCWWKPIDKDQPWVDQVEAERLFRTIAAGIQEDNGFEPSRVIGD